MAKVMISLADDLLTRIDARVEQEETSRSAWLARLAGQELSRATAAEMDVAIARGRKALVHMAGFDSGEEIRKDRDSHKW